MMTGSCQLGQAPLCPKAPAPPAGRMAPEWHLSVWLGAEPAAPGPGSPPSWVTWAVGHVSAGPQASHH